VSDGNNEVTAIHKPTGISVVKDGISLLPDRGPVAGSDGATLTASRANATKERAWERPLARNESGHLLDLRETHGLARAASSNARRCCIAWKPEARALRRRSDMTK
jgi:hypothetical protein